ncbi:uncharacterized protein LOC118179948 [Stegodyphus dumicola]|uniref:uncharacterized protein LOC118179948 n=1 Tax=Stegodyphus dumicola TaxID=202533 RepID=UPI0015AF3497|nr:uncharacterized protein LOC118179948 [Stegodyphus dumicola]
MIGYETTPENVRNKIKYLRNRYRIVMDYNAKHVEKRAMPFFDELGELYGMDYVEDSDLCAEQNGNGSADISYQVPGNDRASKRTCVGKTTIPASHVDLRTVVTSKKKTDEGSKPPKIIVKKKSNAKNRSQPLFQCGLCMDKFRTSYDMHGHTCKPSAKKNSSNSPKKKQNSANSPHTVFHWNSLITMQFLDLLKDYQDSHKSSNFRKGNLWENMCALMKRRGHAIHPKELQRKWNILSSAYAKTIAYNKHHKDKKKCAFFKRLTDLYKHPSSFECFSTEEPVKMTVEVSPFSYASREPGIISRSSSSNSSSQKKLKEERQVNHNENNFADLIHWLDNTWTEWKELEKKREALQAQRHNELMEMLSYMVDSNAKQ